MAAVLCQVIIFGCVFEIVKAVPFRFHTPLAISMGLALLLILYLLYFMRTYLLQLVQHGSLFKKGLAGALTGAGVWWMLSFTISELLFLIILAAIQQIGSFINDFFIAALLLSTCEISYIAIADGPVPTGITVMAV